MTAFFFLLLYAAQGSKYCSDGLVMYNVKLLQISPRGLTQFSDSFFAAEYNNYPPCLLFSTKPRVRVLSLIIPHGAKAHKTEPYRHKVHADTDLPQSRLVG